MGGFFKLLALLVSCGFSSVLFSKNILLQENALDSIDCVNIISKAQDKNIIGLSGSDAQLEWNETDAFIKTKFGEALKELATQLKTYPLWITKDMGYHYWALDKENKTDIAYMEPAGKAIGVIFLNEDVGGGSLWFPRQKREIEPSCGKLVIFPASYTHPHHFKRIKVGKLRVIMTVFV